MYIFIYVGLSACVSVIFRVYALIARPKRGVAGLVPRSRAWLTSKQKKKKMATKEPVSPSRLRYLVSHGLHVPGTSLYALLKLYIHARMNGENYYFPKESCVKSKG